MAPRRVALVLGGGGARGLAHIGALEVLDREGIEVTFVVGSSMGGLIGALYAAGLRPGAIEALARGFRFPSLFIPGGVVAWDRIFRPAVPVLERARFDALQRRLAVVAVELERGRRVVLQDGLVLPAIRATCAVPGVLPPVQLDGRWLVDGGLASVLPVDVATHAAPDVVVAIDVGAPRARRLPWLSRTAWLGNLVPNPLTARATLEVLVRAVEIALERQSMLAAAMVGPQVLVRVPLGDLGIRDFHRLADACAAGRDAMQVALPAVRAALESRATTDDLTPRRKTVLALDPVCDMVVNPEHPAASLDCEGQTIYFCSPGCRDIFARTPEGAPRGGQHAAAPASQGIAEGTVKDGVRVVQVSVTDEGFVPSKIKAKKGEKLRLVVTRKTNSTCAKEIVIKDAAISQPLPLDQTVTVEFTPKKSGEIRYACGMDHVAGVVFVP